MRRVFSFILHSLFFLGCAVAQPLMRDVFAAMPDSVLPMVTRNNRLDCIDFIENNMEAKVRNAVDEYVTLEALTADYARFRTSAASVMELKLLPASPSPSLCPDTLPAAPDTTFVLCVVTTAQTGESGTPRRLEDSNIRFLSPDWSPLPKPIPFAAPAVEAFLSTHVPDSLAADVRQACASLRSFHPLRFQLAADSQDLTVTLQTAYLAIGEKRALRDLLRPVLLHWDGHAFAQ